MIDIQLKSPAALSAGEWLRWDEIQRGNSALCSPYFRPEFTRCVAGVRTDVEIAVLTRGARPLGFFPFQRGRFNLGKPVGGKLSDYHGLLCDAGTRVDPHALLRSCRLAAWDFDHLVAQDDFAPFATLREESPFLDLTRGFAAYCQQRKAAGSDVVAKTNQKARKCEREVGPLRLEFDCQQPEVFQQLLSWKSAQYRRTGLADVFSFAWTVELLAELRKLQGEALSAPLSVLWSGEQPAALALSLRSFGVLHCWFVAYNPLLAAYSPGAILFLRLAEAAQDLGIDTIDLGKGGERYKWSLASGGIAVWEGTLATRSLPLLARNAWRTTRDWVGNSPLKHTTQLSSRLMKPWREWLAYH
jgi:CelD/BcsL family acetyltransferase involved in cellulose biosynthesis